MWSPLAYFKMHVPGPCTYKTQFTLLEHEPTVIDKLLLKRTVMQ